MNEKLNRYLRMRGRVGGGWRDVPIFYFVNQ